VKGWKIKGLSSNMSSAGGANGFSYHSNHSRPSSSYGGIHSLLASPSRFSSPSIFEPYNREALSSPSFGLGNGGNFAKYSDMEFPDSSNNSVIDNAGADDESSGVDAYLFASTEQTRTPTTTMPSPSPPAAASAQPAGSRPASASATKSAVMSLAEALSNVVNGTSYSYSSSLSGDVTGTSASRPASAVASSNRSRPMSATIRSAGTVISPPHGKKTKSTTSSKTLQRPTTASMASAGSSMSLLNDDDAGSVCTNTSGMSAVGTLQAKSRSFSGKASSNASIASTGSSASSFRIAREGSRFGNENPATTPTRTGSSASVASIASGSSYGSSFQRLGPELQPYGGGGPGSAKATDYDAPTSTPSRGIQLTSRDILTIVLWLFCLSGRNKSLGAPTRDKLLWECSRILSERHEPVVVDMVAYC
jgi:hypothetical protein